MAGIGFIGLLLAFASVVVAIVCLVAGTFLAGSVSRKAARLTSSSTTDLISWAGHVAALVACIALTFCCALLVYCFMTGDTSIEYVVRGTSHEDGPMGVLYRLAGLWEGREGSLLFWAWLIAVFGSVIALRNMKVLDKLDSLALAVLLLVLACFISIMFFSVENSPFVAMKPEYFDESGNLTGSAALWGMNPLLEHWAMAVHPPALFIGYAGLTIPFAYAIATLVLNDSSDRWVRRAQRYTVFSWWFLGIGIGLGAVWAYVVLGWGGYWGWDAVENASLLPWLVGLALIHSFTVYVQRGAFKRWSIMCAAITFAFVITGTFISRSGLVESVHAFTGDSVSLGLFGGMIAAALIAAAGGLATRWKSFAAANGGDDDLGSFMSRDAAYYFNNVIMVVFAFVVCYLTISSALPAPLPFAGQSLGAATYDAVARPLGVFYMFVLAICPLLSWVITTREQLIKRGKIPAICAAVAFAALMVILVGKLWPSYDAIASGSGRMAQALQAQGPAFYYKGLSAVGMAVACLVIFNTLYMIVRRADAWGKAHGCSTVAAVFKMIPGHASTFGGYLAHVGMGVILIGLIGSAMFVTEHSGYVEYDKATDSAPDYTVGDYTLKYTGNSVSGGPEEHSVFYTVEFDVYRDGREVGHVAPNMQLLPETQQTKANTAILGFADEDLFVVYQGVNSASGYFSMIVRVNPLIRFVWAGFALLMAGVAIAALGRRTPRSATEAEVLPEGDEADEGDQDKTDSSPVSIKESVHDTDAKDEAGEEDATSKADK